MFRHRLAGHVETGTQLLQALPVAAVEPVEQLPPTRVKRAGLRGLGAELRDAVAHPGRGGDDRWHPQLAPEPPDGHGDGVGERVGVLVPDLFEEVLGAQEGGAGPQEGFEERELLDGEVELPAVPGGRAAYGIELDAGRAHDPGAVSIRTIARSSRSVIIWQRVSPWIPGRSRSRTTTSYTLRSSLTAAAKPSWATSTAMP